MTKELEALKVIIENKGLNGIKEPVAIIETALKNYEELTSKPVILYGRTHRRTQTLIDFICKNYKEVKITNLDDEKKLKAFEIIKKKNVDVGAIKNCANAYAYNDFKELTETVFVKRKELAQEEYNLLKEVLL